jgi:hypothetical protein
MTRHITQVGAADPDRETSPILDEDDEEPGPDDELEAVACYFIGQSYPLGEYVLSGDELLHCEPRGIWVRKGEMRPDDKDIGQD